MTSTTRICIVGEKSVGKTSFINSSKGVNFMPNYNPTTSLSRKIHNTRYNQKSSITQYITLVDTCGDSSVFEITEPGDYHAVIIMFDLTNFDSFNIALEKYTQIKEHFNKDVIILIIGNKSDLHNTEITASDVRKYFKIGSYFEVSNKYNINLTAPIEYIMKKLYPP